MTYAKNTKVSKETSVTEIQRLVERYGATKFGYVLEPEKIAIAFEMRDRRVRFCLPLPNPNSREFTHTPARGDKRSAKSAEEVYQQAIRQRYRALVLAIKAKLESVESGIESFEEAFLAHIVLPDGLTMGEWSQPQLEQAYLTGKMPPLLPPSN